MLSLKRYAIRTKLEKSNRSIDHPIRRFVIFRRSEIHGRGLDFTKKKKKQLNYVSTTLDPFLLVNIVAASDETIDLRQCF